MPLPPMDENSSPVQPHGRAGAVPYGRRSTSIIYGLQDISLAWNLARGNTPFPEGSRGIHRLSKGLGIHHLMLDQPLNVLLSVLR